MARSFSSPQGAPPKMKGGGKSMKIKRHPHPEVDKPLDPLRFASSRLPSFSTRHNNTSNKHGFHNTPARPPSGRLAQRPRKPNRGSGKEHRALL
jgi:hypothetical protein